MKAKCCRCFKLISCQTRFNIFSFLQKHPKSTIGKLVTMTKLRQPTVSFHVDALNKKGLVKKTKKGRQVFCELCQKCKNCPLFSG